MFARIRRIISAYKLWGRCEDALLAAVRRENVSKTKLGAVLMGAGTLCVLIAKVINGEADLVATLPQMVAAIGVVIAVFGGRDAITKAMDK